MTARRALASIVSLLALGLLPGQAQAIETAKLHVSFSPDKLGAPVTINIDVKVGTTDGSVPTPIVGFDTRMPDQLELVSSTLGLAICKRSTLLNVGVNGCSPNARLGFGSASVEVPFGPEVASENASIQVFMGPPEGEQIGVLLFSESRSPVFAQLVFPGTIITDPTTDAETLNTVVPPTPTLPGAADASVTDMRVSIGSEHLTYYKRVHGRRVAYRPQGASLPTVCPRGGFPFFAFLRFLDGTTVSTTSTVPCPPPLHKHHHA